ncbi:hypothetical protein GN956_G13609 [Arapaima gigas]
MLKSIFGRAQHLIPPLQPVLQPHQKEVTLRSSPQVPVVKNISMKSLFDCDIIVLRPVRLVAADTSGADSCDRQQRCYCLVPE